jgi:hypothetical protein
MNEHDNPTEPDHKQRDNGVTTDAFFAIVPERLVYDTSVSDGALRLYAVLDRYANNQQMAWPTRKTLSEHMACSRDTVDRRTRELVDAGWLKVSPRFDEAGDQKSNNYYIMRGGSPIHAATPPPMDAATGSRIDAAHNQSQLEPELNEPETRSELTLARELAALRDDSFEEFWSNYPKRNGVKVGKANARKQWAKLKESERSMALAALPEYTAAKNGYPEDAERYLRNKRWDGLEVETARDRDERIVDGALRFAAEMGME